MKISINIGFLIELPPSQHRIKVLIRQQIKISLSQNFDQKPKSLPPYYLHLVKTIIRLSIVSWITWYLMSFGTHPRNLM